MIEVSISCLAICLLWKRALLCALLHIVKEQGGLCSSCFFGGSLTAGHTLPFVGKSCNTVYIVYNVIIYFGTIFV